jgi:hypothetical protein
MTCVYDPVKAMCQRDKPDDVRRTPDLSNCHPACQNIARTDRDVDQVRRQAAQLEALVADPLSPEPATSGSATSWNACRSGKTLVGTAGWLGTPNTATPSSSGSSSAPS